MARTRVKVKRKKSEGGAYFASPKTEVEFISSGSKLLDLSLGGGWAENRISNVVGDKSSGKTLLAIEASANFGIKYPKGRIFYRESESAFDKSYAKALGMPTERIEPGDKFETIEDLFEDLTSVVDSATQPSLYIVDSLDALSDRDELKRGMDEGTYGTNKAKKLSQLFRRLVRRMSDSSVTVMVVSQIRSNIGVTFGKSTTRSGGRAMDFYASQVPYLRHKKTIKKTRSGVERPVGIEIHAKVEKNKIGLPYRECQFPIMFGYGIDDLRSCVEWLKTVKSLDRADIPVKGIDKYLKQTNALPDDEFFEEMARIRQITEDKWYEIERSFLPARRKY